MDEYIIFGSGPEKGLFWNNDTGWGCRETAAVFTAFETLTLAPPMGGQFQLVSSEG